MLGAMGLEVNEDSSGDASKTSCNSSTEIRGLFSKKISRIFARGSVLFREGHAPRGVYMLCEGRAKVSIGSPDGKILVLRIADAGELLGVNAALNGQPYETTVETLERCRVDFIFREDLMNLLERDPKAYLGVAQALSQELSGVVEHTRLLLLSQSAAEKLARLLIRWCNESGEETSRGTRIDANLTHEEIAQIICASRETVSRLLGEFKRKHIVSLSDNSIFVRNRKALGSIACC